MGRPSSAPSPVKSGAGAGLRCRRSRPRPGNRRAGAGPPPRPGRGSALQCLHGDGVGDRHPGEVHADPGRRQASDVLLDGLLRGAQHIADLGPLVPAPIAADPLPRRGVLGRRAGQDHEPLHDYGPIAARPHRASIGQGEPRPASHGARAKERGLWWDEMGEYQ